MVPAVNDVAAPAVVAGAPAAGTAVAAGATAGTAVAAGAPAAGGAAAGAGAVAGVGARVAVTAAMQAHQTAAVRLHGQRSMMGRPPRGTLENFSKVTSFGVRPRPLEH